MLRLKADLHTHSADDAIDGLPYSSEMLVDAAADAGIQVLAMTGHGGLIYTKRLSRYAEQRGILLIPGAELFISRKHVLVLNPTPDQLCATTFDELRALRGAGECVIAPHPFFPDPFSLGKKLEENIDVFDAIEYCSVYLPLVNFNRRAVRLAQKHGLPMVGTSDTHQLPYRNHTYTWIEAEPGIDGVMEAIRSGRTEVVTRPLPIGTAARIVHLTLQHKMRKMAGPGDEEAALS